MEEGLAPPSQVNSLVPMEEGLAPPSQVKLEPTPEPAAVVRHRYSITEIALLNAAISATIDFSTPLDAESVVNLPMVQHPASPRSMDSVIYALVPALKNKLTRRSINTAIQKIAGSKGAQVVDCRKSIAEHDLDTGQSGQSGSRKTVSDCMHILGIGFSSKESMKSKVEASTTLKELVTEEHLEAAKQALVDLALHCPREVQRVPVSRLPHETINVDDDDDE